MAYLDMYQQNRRERLPHIFEIFGLRWDANNDQGNATTAHRAFVGSVYGQLNVECGSQRRKDALPHLLALGLGEKLIPVVQWFRNTYVWCGPDIAADLRISKLWRELEKTGYRLGTVYIMSGQRRLQDADGDPLGQLCSLNPVVLSDAWVKDHLVGRPWKNNWELTEFEVRVALELALEPGSQVAKSTYASLTVDTIDGVPRRSVVEVLIVRPNGGHTVVRNAPAVPAHPESGLMTPQYTIGSSVRDMAEAHAGLFQAGEDALVVGSNPYGVRLFADVEHALHVLGHRPYLHLATATLSPDDPWFVRHALYELGQRERIAALR